MRVIVSGVAEICIRRTNNVTGAYTTDFRALEPPEERVGTHIKALAGWVLVHLDGEPRDVERWWPESMVREMIPCDSGWCRARVCEDARSSAT